MLHLIELLLFFTFINAQLILDEEAFIACKVGLLSSLYATEMVSTVLTTSLVTPTLPEYRRKDLEGFIKEIRETNRLIKDILQNSKDSKPAMQQIVSDATEFVKVFDKIAIEPFREKDNDQSFRLNVFNDLVMEMDDYPWERKSIQNIIGFVDGFMWKRERASKQKLEQSADDVYKGKYMFDHGKQLKWMTYLHENIGILKSSVGLLTITVDKLLEGHIYDLYQGRGDNGIEEFNFKMLPMRLIHCRFRQTLVGILSEAFTIMEKQKRSLKDQSSFTLEDDFSTPLESNSETTASMLNLNHGKGKRIYAPITALKPITETEETEEEEEKVAAAIKKVSGRLELLRLFRNAILPLLTKTKDTWNEQCEPLYISDRITTNTFSSIILEPSLSDPETNELRLFHSRADEYLITNIAYRYVPMKTKLEEAHPLLLKFTNWRVIQRYPKAFSQHVSTDVNNLNFEQDDSDPELFRKYIESDGLYLYAEKQPLNSALMTVRDVRIVFDGRYPNGIDNTLGCRWIHAFNLEIKKTSCSVHVCYRQTAKHDLSPPLNK